MKTRLTRRQYEVFTFIQDTVASQGVPPSIREIADRFGFSSPSSAEKHLVALEQKGMIKRTPGLARNIEILEKTTASSDNLPDSIPILGQIVAGTPLLAIENFDGFLNLQDLFGDPAGLFALRVTGDSMIGAGIFDGDYVVARHEATISNGEIAVAYLGEDCEATVKRVFFEKDSIRLQPENTAISPIFISKDDPYFKIGGKVVGLLRRL